MGRSSSFFFLALASWACLRLCDWLAKSLAAQALLSSRWDREISRRRGATTGGYTAWGFEQLRMAEKIFACTVLLLALSGGYGVSVRGQIGARGKKPSPAGN